MDTFFTSDTHWFHSNILKHCQNRRQIWNDIESMNEELRELWNKIVRPRDKVYHLGDVAHWSQSGETIKKYIDSLNGTKHLILGNHDQNVNKWKDAFCSINEYKIISVEKNQPIVLFHFAMRTWEKVGYGSWHLFGHTHGRLPSHGRSVDVGIDSSFITGKHEHRPFHYDEIKIFMKNQNQSERWEKL